MTETEVKLKPCPDEALREFARRMIADYCWDYSTEPDGGEVQDVAERLGLIEPHVATEADCKENLDFELGDTIYKFADWLNEAAPSPVSLDHRERARNVVTQICVSRGQYVGHSIEREEQIIATALSQAEAKAKADVERMREALSIIACPSQWSAPPIDSEAANTYATIQCEMMRIAQEALVSIAGKDKTS